MGGNFFFAGLHFDNKGKLQFNDRPYLGTKMHGGASRGNFLFFDPEHRLIEAQYVHGKVKEISNAEWDYFNQKIRETFHLANIPIQQNAGTEFVEIGGKKYQFAVQNFKLIVPRGGLKGYESH